MTLTLGGAMGAMSKNSIMNEGGVNPRTLAHRLEDMNDNDFVGFFKDDDDDDDYNGVGHGSTCCPPEENMYSIPEGAFMMP